LFRRDRSGRCRRLRQQSTFCRRIDEHYAAISTDVNYRPTQLKLTAASCDSFISEAHVYRLLDTLKSTATGLDGIPAWFLRLGAPIFAAPLAWLFNQTIIEVPQQWKMACITPIPKVPREFRPISVTPVLSRSLEKYVVRNYIYPALRNPPPQLNFEDQCVPADRFDYCGDFAILHTVRSMLSTNECTHVFAFDFSKAFDTVRHSTLMSKLATMRLPDSIYNWVRDFFTDHTTVRDTPAICRPSPI